MATQLPSLPVLPFGQIEGMVEQVERFLPIAERFLPEDAKKFRPLIPIIELHLKLASVLQDSHDDPNLDALLAGQMRSVADRLDPPK